MHERYTENAWQAMVFAQSEARALSQGYIGTEHILLGLLREGSGLAARVLESLDITLDLARQELIQLIPPDEKVSAVQTPLTPRSEKVLELALREALSLGHNEIGTEHILLGLVCEGEGVAVRILAALGTSTDQVQLSLRPLVGETRPTSIGALLGKWKELRAEKEAAMSEGARRRATELRDKERPLFMQARAEIEWRQEALLEDLRERLGLPNR